MTDYTGLPLEAITREDFLDYEEVRSNGQWNMYSPQAKEATGLSKEVYRAVQHWYEELMTKWPDVRED